MKTLQINQSDISGGAAIAAYRLHQGLLSYEIESKLLVERALLNCPETSTLKRRRFLENNLNSFAGKLGIANIHLFSSFSITQHPFYQEADIINFHCLHHNYFNYLALPRLTQNKPSVFTLHDMWPFTGHCSYSFDCERWLTGCGQCPYLDTYPPTQRDTTSLEWKLKRWSYKRSSLTIVTPSRWLANITRQSILGKFDIHHIPNGLDINHYQPLERGLCRQALGLPQDKKILLFAAQSLQERRKGSDLLLAALRKIPDTIKEQLTLLMLGSESYDFSRETDIPIVSLGYVESDRLKTLAYSAADLFVFPTRADNLPLVLQESMACGTPIVSFAIGGVPELVRHRETGYLAKPESIEDFSIGIVHLLENDDSRIELGKRCRQIAVTEYSQELQAKRYLNLYSSILLANE